MVTATVTSKGQITIPRDVRQSLRLRAGDKVAFVVRGEDEALLKPVTKAVDDVFGKLHSARERTRSIAEMKAAVARRMRNRPA